MKYGHLVLIAVLFLLAVLAGPGHVGPGAAGPADASEQATDGDGDGVPDPADSCPSLAEDPDGVDDLDGCPDTDVSISAAMDEAYTLSVYTVETRTVEIWIQNGNYPADILVHALSVSTVGACEVSLIAAPGDGFLPHTTDEDGDTIKETYFYLLEWEVSLDAGESYETSRDYEVVCSLLGEQSFDMQVDAVPWPPVEEEDVEDLPNVHKSFPLVTVIDFVPVHDEPTTAAMLASSSSIWMNVPPIMGKRRAILSTTSVDGVIGYPATKRQPAAIAPSPAAKSPSR